MNATLLYYGNCDQAFVYVSSKHMTNTRTASNFLCILDWMLVLRNIQMYPVFDHIFQFILLINTQKKQFEIVGRESISRTTPTKQHINEAL